MTRRFMETGFIDWLLRHMPTDPRLEVLPCDDVAVPTERKPDGVQRGGSRGYPAALGFAVPLVGLAVMLAGCGERRATTEATAARPTPATPPSSDPPAAGTWLVVSVHDGDTVLCLDRENKQHKVRLVGIDAPEIGQPFGTKSREGLRELVLRKSVTVHAQGEDRYGRTLGSLEIDGEDVALRMVAGGLAWHFTRYSDDDALADAERAARAAGRGLWADPEPVPPWDWRASEKDRKAAAKREAAGR